MPDERVLLIVEDEYFLAHDLAEYFQNLGADILGPAGSVGDALQLLDGSQVQGAVLDVNLKGERVYPVADALRQKGVPFVFASSYEPDQIPARFQGIPHVVKPYAMEDLIGVLSALAAQRVAAHPTPDKPAGD